jgi:hypothetical protein
MKTKPLHQRPSFRKFRVSFTRLTPMHEQSVYKADRGGEIWTVACDGSRQYPWRSTRMVDGCELFEVSLERAAETISRAVRAIP